MSQLETKGGNLYKILTFIFLPIIAVAIFLWLNTKSNLNGELKEKEAQQIELQENLNKIMSDHNQLKAENTELTASLAEKDSIIQAKASELEKALKYKWSYFNVKKQFEELQKETENYLAQIDKLKEENQKLSEENAKIQGEYDAEKEKTATLTKTNESLTNQIDNASIVKSFTVTASGVKVRSDGSERVFSKAKKVKRIKVCFTLMENILAMAGPKDIYIRIAGPDNVILMTGTSDQYSFTSNGQQLQYSIKKTVDYQNKFLDVCAYWDKNTAQILTPGTYKVEIYEGDYVIGFASFSLR